MIFLFIIKKANSSDLDNDLISNDSSEHSSSTGTSNQSKFDNKIRSIREIVTKRSDAIQRAANFQFPKDASPEKFADYLYASGFKASDVELVTKVNNRIFHFNQNDISQILSIINELEATEVVMTFVAYNDSFTESEQRQIRKYLTNSPYYLPELRAIFVIAYVRCFTQTNLLQSSLDTISKLQGKAFSSDINFDRIITAAKYLLKPNNKSIWLFANRTQRSLADSKLITKANVPSNQSFYVFKTYRAMLLSARCLYTDTFQKNLQEFEKVFNGHSIAPTISEMNEIAASLKLREKQLKSYINGTDFPKFITENIER
ncbi:MAG TPA: hypothetical protein H9898_09325 [Candidatus Anaerobiospirillum stercoravium]|nr:hypothetical protein [Candidatus Anaerobiospirillum stercoravium]